MPAETQRTPAMLLENTGSLISAYSHESRIAAAALQKALAAIRRVRS